MQKKILTAQHLNKYFHEPFAFQVLHDVSFEITKGEFVSITGKSGCGKSTLLYLLSTLDTDYEGTIYINDVQVTGKSKDELAAFRGSNVGFVFQFHYLLPEFTVLDNVMMPALKLGKLDKHAIEQNAMEKLRQMEMQEHAHKISAKLSGGQQQRVAIARALINDPEIIMADEPTGNLDSANTAIIFNIFRDLAAKGKTIITVTHDKDFAARSDRIIEMADGRIGKAS
jgi:lipoprotein-releasing system ATP-binding protein